MRTFGQIEDDGGVVEANWLRRRTPLGLFGIVLAVLLGFGLCGTVGHFAFGWFNAGVQVISPDNVRAQWQFAYDYDRALGAIAGNWCTAKQVEDAETDPAIKAQRVSQRIAQENLYRTREAAYDAQLANAFKAKLVKPPDVPNQAPTLQQKVAELNCYTPPSGG